MITAHWRIACNVECPYCDATIDLMNDISDSFEWLPKPGHSEELEVEINCPKCEREFTLQATEY